MYIGANYLYMCASGNVRKWEMRKWDVRKKFVHKKLCANFLCASGYKSSSKAITFAHILKILSEIFNLSN